MDRKESLIGYLKEKKKINGNENQKNQKENEKSKSNN